MDRPHKLRTVKALCRENEELNHKISILNDKILLKLIGIQNRIKIIERYHKNRKYAIFEILKDAISLVKCRKCGELFQKSYHDVACPVDGKEFKDEGWIAIRKKCLESI